VKIINLSYAVSKLKNSNPEKWLTTIGHSIGILESMAVDAEVVGIYHLDFKGMFRKNNVTYFFPGFTWWQLLLPIRFNFSIKKMQPDVLIVHGLIFPWQVILLRWQVGKRVKIIAQHHAEKPLRDIRQYFQRWADCYISAYLFCSAEMAKPWVLAKQIGHQRKIKEIMEGSSHFSPIEKAKAKELTRISGQRIFLWVGRLDSNKDPLIVAKAFARFSISNPRAQLYMIFQSVELLNELKAAVLRSKASEKIHLVGRIEHHEIQYWYSSADFIVSSSHYEGSGIAVCEAFSCGCVPILTNIPSFRMMTDNGKIGMLYEAGNEDSLVNAFEKTDSINPDDERKKVLERFHLVLSFHAISKRTLDVIHELDNACKKS
jgi:glycosyltransferase involved in cell wall biosynthesis